MAAMIRSLLFCLGLLPGVACAMPFESPDQLAGADVVVMGEVHDNPAHHLWQGRMLAEVTPAAVVLEMLSPDQAALITPDLLRDLDALAAVIGWSDSGWPDFALYRPVFDGIGTARIYGAALPRERVRAAVTEGAAAQFGGDAARFGLTVALPGDQQTEREALQQAAHCNALPPDLLPGMVAAQRLRDAHFAATVIRAWQDTGGPVVLITGNGHARTDWGVPHILALAAPDLEVIAIGQLETAPTTGAPFDLWRVTEPTRRDDPCAVFN